MSNNVFPNVAQFIDTFFPTIDGVVRTVHNYALNINRSSYSCVFAPAQNGEYTDEFEYDVFRAKSIKLPIAEYRLPKPNTTKRIKEALDSHDFKIFHIHSPFVLGHYAVKEARKRGIKTVATFHSKYYDDAINITGSKLIAKLTVKYIVKLYNKVDSVWAVSRGTAETLRGYGYKGDIFIVDNGTDYAYPDNAEELRKATLEKYNLPEGVPVLLFIGHQIWQKNLKLVLNTAAELKKRQYDFRLFIVGEGYNAKEIKEYSDSLGLGEPQVIFTGQIADKQLLQGIELAGDLFFFPSVYDNAPLVVREAAAMEMPALLMKGSNAAEPTQDGVNAFHCVDDPVSTADKVIEIFSDREKLREVGQSAKRTIGRPWEEIMPTVCEKYWEIIEK